MSGVVAEFVGGVMDGRVLVLPNEMESFKAANVPGGMVGEGMDVSKVEFQVYVPTNKSNDGKVVYRLTT